MDPICFLYIESWAKTHRQLSLGKSNLCPSCVKVSCFAHNTQKGWGRPWTWVTPGGFAAIFWMYLCQFSLVQSLHNHNLHVQPRAQLLMCLIFVRSGKGCIQSRDWLFDSMSYQYLYTWIAVKWQNYLIFRASVLTAFSSIHSNGFSVWPLHIVYMQENKWRETVSQRTFTIASSLKNTLG